MRRHVLLLDLEDTAEAVAGYEAAHRPGHVPDAVLRGLDKAGVVGMTIHRAGNRLVMLMDVAPQFDAARKAAADAADPEIARWETRMDALQRRLPFAASGEKWVRAEQIFDLAEHMGGSHAPGR